MQIGDSDEMDWVHHIESSDSSPPIYLYGKHIHITASLFTSLEAAISVSQLRNSKYAQYEFCIIKNKIIFYKFYVILTVHRC